MQYAIVIGVACAIGAARAVPRVRSCRKVARTGAPGDMDLILPIHGHTVNALCVVAAKERRVQNLCCGAVYFRDESCNCWVRHSCLYGVRSRGKIARTCGSSYVGIAVGVDCDGTTLINRCAAEIRRVDQRPRGTQLRDEPVSRDTRREDHAGGCGEATVRRAREVSVARSVHRNGITVVLSAAPCKLIHECIAGWIDLRAQNLLHTTDARTNPLGCNSQ